MTQKSEVPQPGDIVAEKYTVVRQLGAGGMGAVLEVVHRVTGKHFAVKWMLSEANDGDTMVQRFIREAKVAGRFQHRNVVEVYDVGQEGQSPYMVMELLRGESLHDRLRRGPMNAREAIAVLIPVMRGVQAAHDAGIIHRDLKPDNIFLSHPSQGDENTVIPKVLDFGISKVQNNSGNTTQLTQVGTVLGTPEYMAPEQVRSLPVDNRTDVYALGVILFQMLSGQLPHSGGSYSDIVIKVATEPPADLRKLQPDTPAAVADAVARALAKQPRDRFATVAEFAKTLAPLGGVAFEVDGSTSDGSQSSKTPGPITVSTSKTGQGGSPHVGLMLGVGALLAIAGVGALVLTNMGDKPEVTQPTGAGQPADPVPPLANPTGGNLGQNESAKPGAPAPPPQTIDLDELANQPIAPARPNPRPTPPPPTAYRPEPRDTTDDDEGRTEPPRTQPSKPRVNRPKPKPRVVHKPKPKPEPIEPVETPPETTHAADDDKPATPRKPARKPRSTSVSLDDF